MAVFAASLLLAATLSAQRGDVFNATGATTNLTPSYDSRGGGTVLLLTVFAGNDKKRLDRQSVVKLTNQTTQTVSWQTTTDQSVASFGDMPFGHYDIEVSAVGYITGHKEIEVISSINTVNLDIVLQPDPTALKLDVDESMPSKARKQTKHGVSALKSGNLKQAQKWLDAAYQLAPDNSDLNFLMGYLRYQQKDFDHAQTYLDTAASLNPRDVQSLTLLGRLGLQKEDYAGASLILEKAVAADSEYWMAHDLLAGAYLRQNKYEQARQQAELAIAKAKGGSSSAQLVLGQALVDLGQKQEGIDALKFYLEQSPKSPTAPQVTNLIAELERPDAMAAPASGAPVASTPLAGVDPLFASPEMSFTMRPWQPLGIDESKLSVAAGVTCPLANVMEMSGDRVKELVTDVSRIAAIERLLHEQVDEIGNPITKETRDYNYVASVTEDKPGFLEVDEYRSAHLGLSDYPDHIASSGFAALALVFHPDMRDNFDMTCEGQGEWHGQPVWLVHFRQRDDRPARIHDYNVGGQTYAVKLKGRAWITTDKFQIVRIESELVSPMKPIQLLSEHQIVEYGPVPFQKKNMELWLPKTAEIYFDFRRHRYYRRHSFDHYMLFAVDADEKRKEPQAAPSGNKTNPMQN
ncbi:MAG: tetratricopeptide repeat protein [Candidatus Sulfotelmatobacter sp.]